MKAKWLISICALLMVLGSSTAFAGGVVKAGTVDWPPYYGKNIKDGGFVTDITREALKRTGWEYELEFMNWNRAMGLCKQGKLDMVQGAYPNDERKKEYLMTEKYASVDVVFMKKKGSDIAYSKLEDLKGKKIGMVRGYAYPDAVTKASYLKIDFADKLILNVKKLLAGRIDLLIGAKAVIIDTTNQEMPGKGSELVALDPAVQTNDLHNLFSRKSPNGDQLLADFNKGLEMIKADGTYDAIMKKHGF